MTVTIRIAGESPILVGHKSMLPGEVHQVERGIAEQAIARYGLGVVEIVGETTPQLSDLAETAPADVDAPPEHKRRRGNA